MISGYHHVIFGGFSIEKNGVLIFNSNNVDLSFSIFKGTSDWLNKQMSHAEMTFIDNTIRIARTKDRLPRLTILSNDFAFLDPK